jgi:hypothetical protein
MHVYWLERFSAADFSISSSPKEQVGMDKDEFRLVYTHLSMNTFRNTTVNIL